MDFAHDRIRAARIALGISQLDMAKALGISQPGYQQMESGKRPDMRISTLTKICQILGVSSDWVLGLTGGEDPVFRVKIERNEDGKWEIVPD